jgi:hypothetical protein
MKKILLVLICLAFFGIIRAQELNCTVEVITPQIQGVNPQIFENLQDDMFEFLNNTKWTNDKFTIEERINCSMILNITQATAGSNTFRGELQVVSTRPVYNTDYSSPMMNVRDINVVFDYFQGTQYVYNPDRFENNMVAILAFYAYMIIGYDYDSFSMKGGTPFFQQAQRIVQGAQVTSASGWKAFESDKNRYWLVEDILHKTFEPMRECLYEYHRLGMDKMSEQLKQGRQQIATSLQKFNQIHRVKPLAYNTQQFFLAKSDEIVNIFKEAPEPERNIMYELLSVVDPGNMAKYERMQKGK